MFKNNDILNKVKFSLFISKKYLSSRKSISRFIFIALFGGITIGLATLITVIAVMNGFQYNHISRRIEIGSYHLNLVKKNSSSITIEEANSIKKVLYELKDVLAVVPYTDREVILRVKGSSFRNEQIVKLRAFDINEVKKDKLFLNFFKVTVNPLAFNLSNGEIAIGKPFFEYFYLNLQEPVFITPDITLKSIKSSGVPFIVSELFETGSYDYDRYWAFISINDLKMLSGDESIENIGIKLKKKHNPRLIKKIKDILGDNYSIQTAEEINSGYFMALKLEKTMMYLIFLLIFIMIALSIFGTLKLTITKKTKDIALLKAIGLDSKSIELTFISETVFLSFGGSFLGLLFGILISYNISHIFHIIEAVINSLLAYAFSVLKNIPNLSNIDYTPVIIYDETIYYQVGFPVELKFLELFIICLIIVSISLLAAYLPVIKVSKIMPKEILKK